MKKSIISFFILFSVINISFGFEYNFDNEVLVLCSGSDSVLSGFELINDENKFIDYKISFQGSAASNALIFPSNKLTGTLLPNSKESFLISVLSREQFFGERDLIITFEIEGVKYSKELVVFFNNCHNIVVDKSEVYEKTCLLTPVEYLFKVSNAGPFFEEVELSLAGDGLDFIRLSTDRISLQPNETKQVYVFFYPSQKEGYFFNVLNIENKYLTKSIFLNTSVDKCATSKLIADDEIEVCEGSAKNFSVNLKNTGTIKDFYEVRINSDDLFLTKDVFKEELSAKKDVKLTSSFLTDCGFFGKTSIDYIVSSKENLNNSQYTSSVNVLDCFNESYELGFGEEYCSCDEIVLNFSVNNNGLFKRFYFFEKIDSGLIFPKNNFSVGPKKNLTLQGVYKSCKQGRQKVSFSLVSNDTCFENVVFEKEINLLKNKECLMPFIKFSNKEFDLKNLEQYELSFSVSNEGIKKAEYDISLGGDVVNWVSAITSTNFELNPGESKNIDVLIISPSSVEGNNYDLSVSVLSNDELLVKEKILFKGRESQVPQIVGFVVEARTKLFFSILLFLSGFLTLGLILFFGKLIKEKLPILFSGKKIKRRASKTKSKTRKK